MGTSVRPVSPCPRRRQRRSWRSARSPAAAARPADLSLRSKPQAALAAERKHPVKTTAIAVAILAGAASSAGASIDLGNYTLSATYALGLLASEASAVTYNWDTGTLFVVGDEAAALVEYSTAGVELSSMALTGFEDTESLTYTGSGSFVIGDERIQDVFRIGYS